MMKYNRCIFEAEKVEVQIIIYFYSKKRIQNIYFKPMDSSPQSQVIILYHPTSLTPEQVTQAICAQLQTNVTPYSVVLKEKDRGVLAFIELPSEIGKNNLIQLKSLLSAKRSRSEKPSALLKDSIATIKYLSTNCLWQSKQPMLRNTSVNLGI